MLITRPESTDKFPALALAVLLLGGASGGVSPAAAAPPVEEVADPALPDIAALQFAPGRAPFIVYNPVLCQQAGPDLCLFYRYHEYGHLALRHFARRDISREQKEAQADRWAARHAPPRVVRAAWRFFSSGGGTTLVHGDGPTRAARLVEARSLLAFADGAVIGGGDRHPLHAPFPAFAL
jgi:hypothetical protein